MFNTIGQERSGNAPKNSSAVGIIVKALIAVAVVVVIGIGACVWALWHMVSQFASPQHTAETAAKMGLSGLPARYAVVMASKSGMPRTGGKNMFAVISIKGAAPGALMMVSERSSALPALRESVVYGCDASSAARSTLQNGLPIREYACTRGGKAFATMTTTFETTTKRESITVQGEDAADERLDLLNVSTLLRSHR